MILFQHTKHEILSKKFQKRVLFIIYWGEGIFRNFKISVKKFGRHFFLHKWFESNDFFKFLISQQPKIGQSFLYGKWSDYFRLTHAISKYKKHY